VKIGFEEKLFERCRLKCVRTGFDMINSIGATLSVDVETETEHC